MNSNDLSKVVFIVDGLNLFHSIINTLGVQNCLIDIEKLCKTIILATEKIESVEYFTSYFKGNSQTAIMQRKFIAVNKKSKIINLNLGLLRPRSLRCNFCNNQIHYFKEKYTDVNIAVSLLEKIQDSNLKKIYFLSADKDFAPLIKKMNYQFQSPKIVKISPVGRFNSLDSPNIHLTRKQLIKCQF